MIRREAALDAGLPLKALLWPGSLLASIAHAVFVARAPFLSHEQSWDGQNYSVQDSGGSRGTIAFGEDTSCFVAVFYLQTSGRNPLRQGVPAPRDATIPVCGVPEQLRPLAQVALQYVLQNVDGNAIPVVTSAFWSDPDGARVAASEPWPDVMKHGACLVSHQMLPVDVAVERWAADCEFTPAQTALTEAVLRRRLSLPIGVIQLTPSESQQVRAIASSEAGLQACRESLAEVGLTLT